MRRILCHSDLNQPKPGHQSDRLNITPNRHAARALGVPFYSLKELAQETITQSEKPWSLASPVRAYYQLRNVIRDIINPQDLEGTTRTWMPIIQNLLRANPQLTLTDTLSDRSKQLIQTAIAYQTALHQNQQFDFAELYWQAINVLENTAQKHSLLIYGYFTPSPDEIAFITAIAGDNSFIYLPTGEEDLFSSQRHTIATLKQEGWQTVKSQTKPTALQSQFLSVNPQTIVQEIQTSYQIYSDQDIEARSILTQIKQLLYQGISAQEIVIVTAQDTLWGNLLLDMAWELGIALRLPYNISLSETRLGAWFAHLIQVIDQGFPYELTRRLLHHPLSPFLTPENWQQIQTNPPKNLNQWQTILVNTVVNLQDFPLPTKANRQAWLSTFQELLQNLQIRENAAHWAKESVAYQNLEKGLQALAEPSQEIISWSQWRDELLTSLSILQTTAYPGREGIELHNASSIVGARYTHVFVLDLVEGKLPAAVKDDPVLDFFERQQLESEDIYLPNAADLARQEAARFYQLLSLATESITFSHSRIDRQGLSYGSAEPSSYLDRLGLTASEVILPIASIELARQQYLRHPQRFLDDPLLNQVLEHFTVANQRENQTLTEEFTQYNGDVGIPVNLETHIFSASQLLQLGQCPFKW
ncbi:MAG: PD-(D/E)XK nuclease family protein, partial [Microcystaceae cyanobacterium]